jgi:surface polysaccharide O-acyltransferase-like enzyme
MRTTPNTSRSLWVDYLRSFITVLVVAHHSSLAYTTFANFSKPVYMRSTHPVVDPQRWIGLDIFENFNDVFFMSLMFLIGGFFIVPGLRKKGVSAFIRDRFYRLFIPFFVGVTVLMLFAYYPSYILARGNGDLKEYVLDFFTTEGWPCGPPWFIWVLFLFNLVAALVYPFTTGLLNKFGGWLQRHKNSVGMIFLLWLLATWVLYLPMRWWFGADPWTGIRPFYFQESRLLLYFGYFVFGAIIGSADLENGIFATGSPFVRKWPRWLMRCLLAYSVLMIIGGPLHELFKAGRIGEWPAQFIYGTVYVASCTLSNIAFLTTFRALVKSSRGWWDSLSSNAYGIYLIHYIPVIWCQYILLSFTMPVIVKFGITFVVSLSVSWFLSSLVRRNRLIRRYL